MTKVVVELSDDSDPSLSDNEHDNNDNAGDEEGEEYSEEALEAGKVLQTTNLLLARILSKMSAWFSGGDSNGDGNKPNTSAATGLIVDGALVMHNTVTDDQNLKEWISYTSCDWFALCPRNQRCRTILCYADRDFPSS